MIGIEKISGYIPNNKVSNYDRKDEFGIDDHFIENKIGFKDVSVKNQEDDTSDLCIKAINKLGIKNISEIECLIVVTQNPDKNIPHTSAIVHGSLDFTTSCACFDISLGCSGYVYGLSVIKSFMESNNMEKGLLVTADPYSKIIDPKDKSTSLLFGDGATATLVSTNPKYKIGKFTFGTIGKSHKELAVNDNFLYMNGRSIFNFAAKSIPIDVEQLLLKNNKSLEEIDLFLFHQGSKYVVDTISQRIGINPLKAPFDAANYGNLVSSSIPMILSNLIDSNASSIVLSGFGVGLSWSSTIIQKTQ